MTCQTSLHLKSAFDAVVTGGSARTVMRSEATANNAEVMWTIFHPPSKYSGPESACPT